MVCSMNSFPQSPARSAASIGHSCCVAQQRHPRPVPASPDLVASQKSAWRGSLLTGGSSQNKNRTRQLRQPTTDLWISCICSICASSSSSCWCLNSASSSQRFATSRSCAAGAAGTAEIHATCSHFSHLRTVCKSVTQKPHQLSAALMELWPEDPTDFPCSHCLHHLCCLPLQLQLLQDRQEE